MYMERMYFFNTFLQMHYPHHSLFLFMLYDVLFFFLPNAKSGREANDAAR